MTAPLVTIISIHFNEPEATREMLASLRKCAYQRKEIIVVDNGSTRGDIQDLVNEFQEVLFLKSNKNLGFAGGNNLALPFIKGEYIFFLNNDAVVYPDTIKKLSEFLSSQQDAGLVSPLILFPRQKEETRNRIQFAGTTPVHSLSGRNKTPGKYAFDFDQYTAPTSIPYPHGAALMVKKSMLREVGPMSEDYFLYYEELDWAVRAAGKGWNTYLFPGAKIEHRESLSTGQESPTKTYYLDRSRILFMQRNYPGIQFLAFILFFVLVALPKDVIHNLSKCRPDIINAKWKAVKWHLKRLFEKGKKVSPANVTITPLLPLTKSFHLKANIK